MNGPGDGRKKSFDANVSRAKPRLRLGSTPELEELAKQVAGEGFSVDNYAPLESVAPPPTAVSAPRSISHDAIRAALAGSPVADNPERREQLRARLKAARERPNAHPLPDTVAEAGQLALSRIAALQAELLQARATVATLSSERDEERRIAERATDDARVRTAEAKRLAAEVDSRNALLSDAENEIRALENERDEVGLALSEARKASEALRVQIETVSAERDAVKLEMEASLSEEEEMAAALESARATAASLTNHVGVLQQERDGLARKVDTLEAEREELLEARRALEAVHRALSSAIG